MVKGGALMNEAVTQKESIEKIREILSKSETRTEAYLELKLLKLEEREIHRIMNEYFESGE